MDDGGGNPDAEEGGELTDKNRRGGESGSPGFDIPSGACGEVRITAPSHFL